MERPPAALLLLCIFLLAGLGVAEVGRAIGVAGRPPARARHRCAVVARHAGWPPALAVLIVVGLPLGLLPGGYPTADGAERWLGLERRHDDRNVVARLGRVELQRATSARTAYPEYHGLHRA